jgi:hypothetical protein
VRFIIWRVHSVRFAHEHAHDQLDQVGKALVVLCSDHASQALNQAVSRIGPERFHACKFFEMVVDLGQRSRIFNVGSPLCGAIFQASPDIVSVTHGGVERS